MNFAQRLSGLMDSHALTNYQLAKDLDIHPTTVTNWLSGKTPRKKTLAILSAYFGVSIEYLLGNEEQKKPTAEKAVSDEDIKFALFGDASVSDEDFEDVKRFAEFIKNKKKE